MAKPLGSQLEKEALAGASLRLRASDYLSSQFVKIATACAKGGGHLTIFDAGTLLSSQREKIARAAPGRVSFEF
jgi:hypothetical protein